MRGIRGFWAMLTFMLVLLVAGTAAVAGGSEPTKETCSNVGEISIGCYDCTKNRYGEYLSVAGEYNAEDSTCFNEMKIRKECAAKHGIEVKQSRFYARYTIGTRTYEHKPYCP